MLIGTHADFSQEDPRWANDLLGFSTWEKLGPFGCLVTAFANVAQAQGADFDPNTMNEALKAKNLFLVDSYGQKADVAGYAALTEVAPSSKFVEQQNWPINVVAPIEYFDVGASVDTEIIIMINYHPSQGFMSHYCRVIGVNPQKTDVEIVDSFTGKRIWLSSISNPAGKTPLQLIYSAGKYSKV